MKYRTEHFNFLRERHGQNKKQSTRRCGPHCKRSQTECKKSIQSSGTHPATFAGEFRRIHSGRRKDMVGFQKNAVPIHISSSSVTQVAEFPEEQRESIFKPFTEVKDLTQGDGLGLPICSLIATKMNGSLTLDSGYTKGGTICTGTPRLNKMRVESYYAASFARQAFNSQFLISGSFSFQLPQSLHFLRCQR